MRWVYCSPHFDDVVLSCGGLVWEQVQVGNEVQVWTICAGEPLPGESLSPFAQQLHARWQTGAAAVAARKQEDQAAIARLGASSIYWDLPDCIYRRLPDDAWLVNGEEDLWLPVHPQEEHLVYRLSSWMTDLLLPGDTLISPLTLGNHVDHRLVRAAAEQAAQKAGVPLLFYADYPYAVQNDAGQAVSPGGDWTKRCFAVSTEGLSAWQDAVAGYVSQISTFWGGLDEMKVALESFWRAGGGSCLWDSGQVRNA